MLEIFYIRALQDKGFKYQLDMTKCIILLNI